MRSLVVRVRAHFITHRHPLLYQGGNAQRVWSHARALGLCCALLQGRMVAVQTKVGKQYEGILHSGWWQAGGPQGVCLHMARPLLGPEEQSQKPVRLLAARIHHHARASPRLRPSGSG